MNNKDFLANLGPLERAVLEALWQRAAVTSVRDLHEVFGEKLAYTTLMTTLDRLYKKGLLKRSKAGRAFLYEPCVSATEYQRSLTARVLNQLITQLSGRSPEGVEPLLACIIDVVSDHDRELLDELDRLIQEKRRGLNA
jgi:predicted transcriptional regulator